MTGGRTELRRGELEEGRKEGRKKKKKDQAGSDDSEATARSNDRSACGSAAALPLPLSRMEQQVWLRSGPTYVE